MPGPPDSLVSLYRGALIGQALSKQLGTAQATGGDIGTATRQAYLQSGVATGAIDPKSLSSSDSELLGAAVANIPKIPTPGGGLLDTLLTPVKIVTNTAGDLVNAVESLPAGLEQLGKSLYKTAQETPLGGVLPGKTGGPDILGLAGDIAKSTVHDFTNFDPMHPLNPALDLAAVVSGGTSALVRSGGAVSRLAAEGRAAEAGAQVGRIGSTLGRSATVQKLGDIGQSLSQRFGNVNRPEVPVTSAPVPGDVKVPSLPLKNYSISPFRKLFVEKPIETLFNSPVAQRSIPGFAEGTSLADLRGAFQTRKASNISRGRMSAESVARATEATQPFNHAMQHLLDTSANDTQALEKFNALTLMRMLGAENMTPEERLNVLEDYRNRVLATGMPQDLQGVPITEETQQIREFNRKLTATAEYRQYFSEPDEAMLAVAREQDKAILAGLKAFQIDPHEILQRSLGPAAYIRAKTPEELLREQPVNVQKSMNFSMGAHEIEQALKASGGAAVNEEALIPQLAKHLPTATNVPAQVSYQVGLKLVKRAVESLRADIAGEHTPRELLNNAHATGYLPGNNLAQKVANALPSVLGVDPAIAEPFATGGLTNYFPQASALPNMKVRPNGGPISRSIDRLVRTPLHNRGWVVGRENRVPEAGKLGLHEFKRENLARLLNANTLGVGPFAGFLKEADLSAFKAGVDRRDPISFVRHISQRERVLTHRLLSEPFIHDMAVKDAEGNVIRVANDTEKAEVFGSTVAAAKYTIISPQALQALVQSEDKAALDVANALKDVGEVNEALMAHIDNIVSEGAQMSVRQLADEAIASKGKGIIVPNSYVQNLIKHAQVLDSGRGVTHLWQAFINKWRSAVLAYMPSWLLRTSVGHGFILFLSGVWDPRHYFEASNYFKQGFKFPGIDRPITHGLDRAVPAGIEQGMPHTEFGQIGQNQYMKNMVAPAITGAVHRVANFQRRAAFLSIFNRIVKQHMAELGEALDLPGGLHNFANLDKMINEHPDWVHHTINEIDRVSYTFGQMSPWERRLAKNVLPFWGWYKFVSKFVWNLPLTYPGRALAITRLGQIGESDQNLLGPMPDWLRASIMFDTHNLSNVHYMSMLGLNPLGDVMDPAQGFQGLVRLGQMSPVIQAALEGAGYNTLTGGLESIDPSSGIVEVNGKYFDTHTGKEYDTLGQASVGADLERFFGGLVRSFPEARIGETVLTQGKPVYPESIPFLNERPIPGTLTKSVSPLGILAQYTGVAPKAYNLQKYDENLLKGIRRAITTSAKAKAKEKANIP